MEKFKTIRLFFHFHSISDKMIFERDFKAWLDVWSDTCGSKWKLWRKKINQKKSNLFIDIKCTIYYKMDEIIVQFLLKCALKYLLSADYEFEQQNCIKNFNGSQIWIWYSQSIGLEQKNLRLIEVFRCFDVNSGRDWMKTSFFLSRLLDT